MSYSRLTLLAKREFCPRFISFGLEFQLHYEEVASTSFLLNTNSFCSYTSQNGYNVKQVAHHQVR